MGMESTVGSGVCTYPRIGNLTLIKTEKQYIDAVDNIKFEIIENNIARMNEFQNQ